uniref:Uncharacterized protein n=1 Tax=Cairina moschata TaxID=8855 RepID=A0A8C3C3F6_CAIMO
LQISGPLHWLTSCLISSIYQTISASKEIEEEWKQIPARCLRQPASPGARTQ